MVDAAAGDPNTLALLVLRALNACLADEIDSTPVWGIAYSGGLDSTVLLHACRELLGAECLHAFHVHHGLQSAADSFAEHANQVCSEWGIRFETLKLTESPPAGASVEAWASEQRYRAIAQAVRRLEERVAQSGENTFGAAIAPGATLTAHQEDDQAETVMLRLLRGTGSRGLTGIAPELLRQGHRFMRPLLTVPRIAIEAYAAQHSLHWVEDPSNQSHRFARNAVRQRLMPLMNELAPGASHRIASAAKHWREADQLMRDYLMADLATLVHVISLKPRVEVFDCAQARGLTNARVAETIRFWLTTLGHEAPSEARLSQILHLIHNVESPYGEVEHGSLLMLKYRDELFAVEHGAAMLARIAQTRCEVYAERTLDDHAQTNLSAKDYSVAGQLIRTPMGRMVLRERATADDLAPATEAGTHAQAARHAVNLPDGQMRIVNYATGTAFFRAAGQTHARSLKDSLQVLGIPRWLRPMLPTLSVNGQLLWVAGLGASADAALPVASDDDSQDAQNAAGNGKALGKKALKKAAAKAASEAANKAAEQAAARARAESRVRLLQNAKIDPSLAPAAARIPSSKVSVDWSWGSDDAGTKLPEHLLADWFVRKSGG